MGRPLAQFRGSWVSREDKKLLNWSKPLLVEALLNMPSICPPRVTRQSKDYLRGIVEHALWGNDFNRSNDDPIRLAMQRAMKDARDELARR